MELTQPEVNLIMSQIYGYNLSFDLSLWQQKILKTLLIPQEVIRVRPGEIPPQGNG